MNYRFFYWCLLLLTCLSSCKEQINSYESESSSSYNPIELKNVPLLVKVDTIHAENAPNGITRNIIEDRSKNIWFATFKGIFKYDGISFVSFYSSIGDVRFFSALEDRLNHLWFGSIGSGVFRFDGKVFQNYSTDDGLLNNAVVCIYEDKIGNIWFGLNGGLSIYDGKIFRNYIITGDTIVEDRTGRIIPNLEGPTNEVNSIVEDKDGIVWLATRGYTFTYDGKSFRKIIQNGKPFSNVRSLIEDKSGDIWLGGNDGLWRYNKLNFNNYSDDFVGYIYEDSKGNIWTSSGGVGNWKLSRYDYRDLKLGSESATEIKSGEGMFFGILEDSDGNIWSGTLNGVVRYNGESLDYFRAG